MGTCGSPGDHPESDILYRMEWKPGLWNLGFSKVNVRLTPGPDTGTLFLLGGFIQP